MGTSGSGKSTIGEALAKSLGWAFIEADQYHPPENIQKMASGMPLTDEDRAPWLAALRREIDARLAAGTCAILACSALRESYRRILRTGNEAAMPIVYLKADAATLEDRLKRRRGHYMGAAMLESQLQTLEEPDGAIVIPLELPVDEAVEAIRAALDLKPEGW